MSKPVAQVAPLSVWPGENSVNISVGEVRVVLSKQQAEWLNFRLTEMLAPMQATRGGPVAYDAAVVNAARAVEKARTS